MHWPPLTKVDLLAHASMSQRRMQWSHPQVTTSSALGHTTPVTGWVWPDKVTSGV